MRYRRLGQTDIEVSVVGLGAWQVGAAGGSWGSDFADDDSLRAIQAAPESGINLIDTAPVYQNGRSEELVGRAVKGRRDEYVIATKISTNQITRAQVRAALEASLKRLDMDHVDLLQIHWPNSKGEPFAETIAALAELREEGKTRAIGVSNFSAAQLAECQLTAPLDSLQPPYNLLWRHIETDTLPFCRERGISVLCYSPLAQGLLSGKYDRGNRPQDGTRPRNLLWHGRAFDIALGVVDVLREIAARHETTCARVALAWLLHQPGVTSVLAGAKRPEQVADNAGAAEIELTAAEIQALAEAGQPLLPLTAGEPKMWFTGQAGEYDIR